MKNINIGHSISNMNKQSNASQKYEKSVILFISIHGSSMKWKACSPISRIKNNLIQISNARQNNTKPLIFNILILSIHAPIMSFQAHASYSM